MKKITLISLLLMLIACSNINAQTIEPVKKEVGRLTISVDPRIEALSIIQTMSSYPVVIRKGDYYESVERHFSPYDDLSAVTMTDNFVSDHGFGFDAPIRFMLHLSHPPKFKKVFDYNDSLIDRAGKEENLEEYRKAIKEFVDKSDFAKFFDENRELYNKMIEQTIEDSYKVDWVKALEDYYNQKQNSYNIILNTLSKGGFGPNMEAENGELDIYNICTTNKKNEDGIPYVGKDAFALFAWHEFSHSFIKPLMEKHIDEVNKSSKLFEPLRESMKKQAYGYWDICAEEHIVRAVVIRLYSLYLGEEITSKQLEYEAKRDFIYVEALVEKLKEYENLRDTKDITFAEFFPELITVFETASASNK